MPAALRQATRTLHTRAERSGLMAALLRGRIRRADYTALLVNLHALYQALETALDQARADPAVAPLLQPALYRRQALAQDLHQLLGPGWPQHGLLPATQDYVQRLQALPGSSRACTLAAHAYVRYLGDLHGGQVLARQVGQALAASGDPGPLPTAFYDFGPPDRVLALRQDLRRALSALVLQPGQADAIVAEACWAFEQHARLFEQLQAAALPG